ncbi:hypothetical protein EYC80_003210 [Monilinia laxa]|uniref:CCHC-type domain-containing protein n=1 Tax=Monilinia laxa TaxID=61186 RepID=A0A5N6KD05_MONLA|nr:hypothetical protein EYC80_003210 [Monilinia laxa]
MFSWGESRQKGSWEEDALLELLYRSPDQVTEDDLRIISLSNLSKNVNSELPGSLIMKIYIRWLEAHRKSHLQLFKAWPNTVKQWAESLKHRGFVKEEVISDVENWKKTNGLFGKHSKACIEKKHHEEKHLPSIDEIKRAFDENHIMKERALGNADSKRESFQADRSSGKMGSGGGSSDYVPMNYICNRCGKNGHSVKNCPTNMDPAFDKKPPETYKCCICNRFGNHWYGLCPRNTDKDSITQRRLAARIEVPAQHGRSDKRGIHKPKLDHNFMLDDKKYKGRQRDSKNRCREKWEAFRASDSLKREQVITLDYGDIQEPALPAPAAKLELFADIEERIHQVSAAMARDTGMTVEGVAEMTGVTISNMAATIMAANRKRARPVELDDADYTENKRTTRQKLEYDDKDELMHDVEDGQQDANISGILKETEPYTKESGLRENLTFTRSADSAEYSLPLRQSVLAMRPRAMSPMDTSSEEDIQTPVNDMEEGFDSPRVRAETPEKIYSNFVKELIENRTEGPVVNERRRRPTALQIWDEDDQRRMRQLDVSKSTSLNSPTLSSISSLASDFPDGLIKVDHPIDHSLDRDVSEIPRFSFEHIIPVSPTSDITIQEAMPEGPADFDYRNATGYLDGEFLKP